MLSSLSISNLVNKIKKWYQGKLIEPDNDPDSIIFRFSHVERPLLAKILIILGKFWLNHWKWILMFLIGVAGVLIALSR